MNDIIDKTKYYPPLHKILVDRNFVFAVTYTRNENDEYLTDVFDLITLEFLVSLYLPVEYSSSQLLKNTVIKNGFLYILKADQKSFPTVEKYKIDSRIYTK